MDERWVAEELARREAQTIARLRDAITEADAKGKETFDLERFETLCDTSTDLGYSPPVETRRERWGRKYYLDYPQVMTISEFADLMNRLQVYR